MSNHVARPHTRVVIKSCLRLCWLTAATRTCQSACGGEIQATRPWTSESWRVCASLRYKFTKVSLSNCCHWKNVPKPGLFLLQEPRNVLLQSIVRSIFVKEKKIEKRCMFFIRSGSIVLQTFGFHCPTLFESFCTVSYFGIKQFCEEQVWTCCSSSRRVKDFFFFSC